MDPAHGAAAAFRAALLDENLFNARDQIGAENYANSGNPILTEGDCKWLEDHPYSQYQDYQPWGKVSGRKRASRAEVA